MTFFCEFVSQFDPSSLFSIIWISSMIILIVIPLLLFTLGKVLFYLYPSTDDSTRTIEEIITSRGFICEGHKVITEDGYILTLHRIVHPDDVFKIKCNTLHVDPRHKVGKPVVLLQHGMMSNSRVWIISANDGYIELDFNKNNSKEKTDSCLAFALAKRGYDVFLGNFRGSSYSLGHTTLDHKKDKKFWDCSMMEIINYDLPATIDYILDITEQKTLGYIGFSQGTTIMFGLLSEQPKYNPLIKPFIAMAPITNCTSTTLKLPSSIQKRIYRIVEGYCDRNPGPSLFLSLESVTRFFNTKSYFRKFHCVMSYYICLFSNKPTLERAQIFTVTASSPYMRKNLAHVIQNHFSTQFRKYDYGTIENLRRYGTEVPPEIDLNKISNRFMSFIYSKDDVLVRYNDVVQLKKRFKVGLIDDYVISGYNHFDFHLSEDLGEVINRRVIQTLEAVKYME